MTAKRVLISIDQRLLEQIDQRVQRLGLTRSGYLALLASADLEARRPVPLGANSLESIDTLFAEG